MVKMTRYIICILLLLLIITINSIAQDIAINLSIRWDNHIDANGKTIQAPFLDITYINNSIEKKYYLLKQSRQEEIGSPFPEFYNDNIFIVSYVTTKDYMKAKYNKFRGYTDTTFFGQKYFISIDNDDHTWTGTYWSAKKDTTIRDVYDDEYENVYNSDTTSDVGIQCGFYYDLIEYAIVSAYDSMYISNYGHTKVIRSEFAKTEFTDSTISNSAIDNFVFLNPKEKHVDTYNLHGLQLVGGNFEILFKKNIITDKVYNGHYWDIKSQKMVESYIKLPQKVNGYQLYSGKFKTNHAFLEIKE